MKTFRFVLVLAMVLSANLSNGAEKMRSYSAKIRISPYGQTTMVTIQANSIQDARRLLEMQYGSNNVVGVWP